MNNCVESPVTLPLNVLLISNDALTGQHRDSNDGHYEEALFHDLLQSAAHVNLGVVEVLVDEFQQGLICATEVISIRIHQLWHCKLAVY